ncbi:uncharacterized protein [Diadema antillarum]|uniref:uncharacterized protein n=1 Tax=Diadema antillarum TaxID=105358 RepID=UPI003A895B1E
MNALPGSPSAIRTPSVGDKEQQQSLPQKQRTTQYGGITKSLPAESKSKAPPSEEQPSLVMKEDEYDLLCPQLPGIPPAIRLTPSIDDEEQQRSLPPKQRTTQYGGIHKPLSSDSTSKTSSPVTIEHEYAVLCPEFQGSPPASIGDEEEQQSLPPNQRTTLGGITRPLSSDPTSKAPSSKGQSSLVMAEDVYDVLRPQSPGSPSAIRLTPSIGDEQPLQRSPPPKQRTTQYGGITRPLSSDSTGRATPPVTNEHEYGVLCPPARFPASLSDEEQQLSLPSKQRTTGGGITRPLSPDPTTKASPSEEQSSLATEEDVYDVLRPQLPGSPSAIHLTPSIGDEQHLQRSLPPKQRTTGGGITIQLSSDSTTKESSPVTNEHEYGVLCPPARARISPFLFHLGLLSSIRPPA